MREIDDLVSLGRYAGVSPTLCQGAGGNASVKRPDEGVMWIKASGYRLSAMSEGNGYLRMRLIDRDELENSVKGMDAEDGNRAMSSLLQSLVYDSTATGSGTLRPSMETWFHIVLDHFVLHTHPIYANAFSCMEEGERELDGLLAERPAVVEYRQPGHLLGEAVQKASEANRDAYGNAPATLLLENHGLITTGKSAVDVTAATEEVLKAGKRFFGPLDKWEFSLAEPDRELVAWACELQRLVRNVLGWEASARPARFAMLHAVGMDPGRTLPDPLVPDDVICNGRETLVCQEGESASNFLSRHASSLHFTPHFSPHFSAAIAVRGKGFVFLSPSSQMIDAMEEQAVANVAVRKLIAPKGKCRPLPSVEMDALLAMESEKYRRTLLVKGAAGCRL